MRNFARDKGESPINKTKERVVAIGTRIERIIAECHARVSHEIERAAVWKSNPTRRTRTCLNKVTFVDGIADIERNRHAVANDGYATDDLLNFAN